MKKSNCWKEIGKVGVDSGSLLIIDPSYIPPVAEFEDELQDYYKKNLATLIEQTGDGDGHYSVLAKYKKSGFGDVRIAEIKIVFF